MRSRFQILLVLLAISGSADIAISAPEVTGAVPNATADGGHDLASQAEQDVSFASKVRASIPSPLPDSSAAQHPHAGPTGDDAQALAHTPDSTRRIRYVIGVYR